MILSIPEPPRFGVLLTDYFGGAGSQGAVAYQGIRS
jgi:hypothetical protein